jgi:YHS domain-containing protein
MKKIIILSIAFTGFVACKNKPSEADKAAEAKRKNDSVMQAAKAATIDISKLNFASKNDTTCGMPISAGVEDTATVNGKLYGFCSKECKESFLKTATATK